ncbi:MAG: CopD family protein [Saccharospirillaceae bacterium]|nr:CopD family protein [Pseudomonadales bacterium]NRB79716.1 CopD family protein [Saccharospirillaceae bacterium]
MFEFIQFIFQFLSTLLIIHIIGFGLFRIIFNVEQLDSKLIRIVRILILLFFPVLIINYLLVVIIFADEGIAGLFDVFYHELILSTNEKWIGLISILSIIFSLIALHLKQNSFIMKFLFVVFSLGILSRFTLSGHFFSEGLLFWSVIALHTFSVCFWIGSLYPLIISCSDKYKLKPSVIKQLMNKFGTVAILFVSMLLITGSILTYKHLPDFNTITTSFYHIGLLFKLLLVGLLLLIALWHKFYLVKNLIDSKSILQLKKSITIEWIISFIIIFITTYIVRIIGLN